MLPLPKRIPEVFMGFIFLIDDEKFILRALSQMIEALGHTVQTATSGFQARDFFRPDIFDVVIADLNLPDTDGLTLLKEFREDDETLKTVLITGYPTIQALAQATNEGVDAYITKPFSMGEIISTLERLVPAEGRLSRRLHEQDMETGFFSRFVKKWRPSA
jgi:DNA-binding NtrC family response regulator